MEDIKKIEVYCVEGTQNSGSSGRGLGTGWPKFEGVYKHSYSLLLWVEISYK